MYNLAKIQGATISGINNAGSIKPRVFIGNKLNGFLRGDLLDANAIDELTEKKIKESGGSGASNSIQSDWNANEGQAGHILNRPFYSTVSKKTYKDDVGEFGNLDTYENFGNLVYNFSPATYTLLYSSRSFEEKYENGKLKYYYLKITTPDNFTIFDGKITPDRLNQGEFYSSFAGIPYNNGACNVYYGISERENTDGAVLKILTLNFEDTAVVGLQNDVDIEFYGEYEYDEDTIKTIDEKYLPETVALKENITESQLFLVGADNTSINSKFGECSSLSPTSFAVGLYSKASGLAAAAIGRYAVAIGDGAISLSGGYYSIYLTGSANQTTFTIRRVVGENLNIKSYINAAILDYTTKKQLATVTAAKYNFDHSNVTITLSNAISQQALNNVRFNIAIGRADGRMSLCTNGSIANGLCAMATGEANYSGENSFSEGFFNTAAPINASSNVGSHAEGHDTIAEFDGDHAEGGFTTAHGRKSHAEGNCTEASGYFSHVENGGGVEYFKLSGSANAVEYDITAYENIDSFQVGRHIGYYSKNSIIWTGVKITKVSNNKITTDKTLDENSFTNRQYCFCSNLAFGLGSHSEGSFTKAIGKYSHTEGNNTIAKNECEHASGKFNTSRQNTTIYSIGVGNSNTERANALEVGFDGTVSILDNRFYGIPNHSKPMFKLEIFSDDDTLPAILNMGVDVDTLDL